jgi:hypothetical protein
MELEFFDKCKGDWKQVRQYNDFLKVSTSSPKVEAKVLSFKLSPSSPSPGTSLHLVQKIL